MEVKGSQGKFSAVPLLTRWRATSWHGAIRGERNSVAYIPDGATLTCPRARIKAKLLHRKRKRKLQ
jgi:hypothetical protein